MAEPTIIPFEFKGRKYNLRPLSPSQVCVAHRQMKSLQGNKRKEKEPMGRGEEPKSGRSEGEEGVLALRGKDSMVMLARKGDVFKKYDNTTPMLLLAHVLNANPSTSPIPSFISNVLQKFDDVFPRELPQGLPPLREIEHQIDLVQGSQLPNKPTYRSNPTNTNELQWQVEDLLNKGYIKKSMSPCAVPVLLVSKKDGMW
ncbi:uncharacterized protein LOC107868744 [Capsicum annuum]|uniref:uncharacterized protein LOC107868744 n=1 Tax=Capsicum annuum TaxID=4072 RepID=UPI0007BF1FFB|nr:uncharacterized protein LOC107868744 [Capsicum annuum]